MPSGMASVVPSTSNRKDPDNSVFENNSIGGRQQLLLAGIRGGAHQEAHPLKEMGADHFGIYLKHDDMDGTPESHGHLIIPSSPDEVLLHGGLDAVAEGLTFAVPVGLREV